jgi:S-DNA-T family DNA segregation ATPase FtsK/SpoIIIE
VAELEGRARIFKAAGVRDFAEYRNASRKQLPRVLLVIDEFQVLFSERHLVPDAAEQLLSQLLKQGRSFGIHILLATQTLKGISALSISALITQLGCRIALACGQEDSAMILSVGNSAASELRSPPEGILNNANGAKSGNVKFLSPLAESTFTREHIKRAICNLGLEI